MAGILFLTSDDLILKKTPKGTDILTTKFQGISLLLFYAPKCEHSQKLIPLFRQLPNVVSGCYIGMVNVISSQALYAKCKLFIKDVPQIVIYYNGSPYMFYTSNRVITVDVLRTFISDVSNQLNVQRKFIKTQEKAVRKDVEGGIPVCGDDDDYYLEFKVAYNEHQLK